MLAPIKDFSLTQLRTPSPPIKSKTMNKKRAPRNLWRARTRKKTAGRSTGPTRTSTASKIEAPSVTLHPGSGAARTSTKSGHTGDEAGAEQDQPQVLLHVVDWGVQRRLLRTCPELAEQHLRAVVTVGPWCHDKQKVT